MLGPKARKTIIKVKILKAIEIGETFTALEVSSKIGEEVQAVAGVLQAMYNTGCLRRFQKRIGRANEWKLLRMPPEWKSIKDTETENYGK